MKKSLFTLFVSILFLGASAQVPTIGLSGYYKFNNSLNDYSDNNYHGTYFNAVGYTEGYSCGAVTISDDTASGISIDNDVLNGAEDFSITAFIRINGLNNYNNLISASNSAQDNNFGLYYNLTGTTNNTGWGFVTEQNNRVWFDPDTITNDGSWHQIAFVRQGNKARLYIDGKQYGAEKEIDTSKLIIDENGLIIGEDQDCVGGCWDTDQNWDGDIDELRFYKTALDSSQIISLYEDQFCINTVIVYDTVLVTVTDTLLIDITVSTSQTEDINQIKVFPNPANDIVHINTGNYNKINDYTIEIINSQGAIVFESLCNQQEFQVDITSLGSNGLYFIKIIDNTSQIIDIRKMIIK